MAEPEDEIVEISSDEEEEEQEQEQPEGGVIDLLSDDNEEDQQEDSVAVPGAVAAPDAVAAAAAAPPPPQPRSLPTEEKLMSYAEQWFNSAPADEDTFLDLCSAPHFWLIPTYQFFYLRNHDPDRLEREVFQFDKRKGYALHALLRATEDWKYLLGHSDPRNIVLPLLKFARERDAEAEGSKGSRYIAMMMFECSYPKVFAGVKALHLAAMGQHITIEIMEEIINAYPQALNQTAGRKRRTPLDFLEWKYFPDGGRTPAPTELSQADKLRGEFITAQLVEHSDILEKED